MTNDFLRQSAPAVEHLQRELRSVRTGRANPEIVQELLVDAYGVLTPLQQLASITATEPRLIVIQPWDPSLLREIEHSLMQSTLGITPVVDGTAVRLPFPAMTEDRRRQLSKVVDEKGEQARIRIRTVREDIIKHWKKAEKNGEVSEDVLEMNLKNLQTAVAESLRQVETIVTDKQAELMKI